MKPMLHQLEKGAIILKKKSLRMAIRRVARSTCVAQVFFPRKWYISRVVPSAAHGACLEALLQEMG